MAEKRIDVKGLTSVSMDVVLESLDKANEEQLVKIYDKIDTILWKD